MIEALRTFLSSGYVLAFILFINVTSVAYLWYDLKKNNDHIASFMKLVWSLTVLYSGLIGLFVYFKTGRKEIQADNTWKKSFRSDAHCYSGCGIGEITGVVIAAGLLSLNNLPVAVITFALAYVFGFALTVLPLVQAGESWGTAFKDAVISESPSITIMEIVAISTDLFLAGEAHIGDALFWNSLIFSLSMGFLAAYPVNYLLISKGVKSGMASPVRQEQ